MEELALKIENVSKEYRLGQIGGATLKGELQSKMAKLLHKEDPNLKIGEKAHGKNERFLALNGVSFDIKKGERIGILGHNGAGKSTLLKLICRVTAPSTGNIYMNGRITSMLEVGTGFHNELTGRENIYLNGAILGMSKAEVDKKFDEIVEFSEIGQFIDTPIKRYSSGMKVKLGFAVASHLESEIMIMDEVLAVGDVAFQNKCINRMREVAETEGRTIIYVSHNMDTVRKLCDRCVVLEHGKVIFDGDVEEAIAIYLNTTVIPEAKFVDLNKRERPIKNLNRVHIQSFEYINSESCIFYRNSPMRFCISWESIKDIENVRFRMIIRTCDDMPVGLVQSPILGNYKKGNVNKSIFEFDISNLVEGNYFLSIAFFLNDEIGNSEILDHVTRATKFSVVADINDDRKLNWEQKYWGSISFPNLVVCDGAKYE